MKFFKLLRPSKKAKAARCSASTATEKRAGKNDECCVCFRGDAAATEGVACSNGHFVCRECFSPYVRSLCEDVGLLKDRSFQVSCPHRNQVGAKLEACTAPAWTSRQLRSLLAGEVLDLYIDTLTRMCNCGMAATDKDLKKQNAQDLSPGVLIEALNLKCPQCNVMLDPNPDGCCAMRCSHCSTHFCFLCLEICANSSSCHSHVRSCKLKTSKLNFFLKTDEIKTAQKQAHIILLRKAIIENMDSSLKWEDVKYASRVLDSVQRIYDPHLKDLQITVNEVIEFNVDANLNTNLTSPRPAQRNAIIDNAAGRYRLANNRPPRLGAVRNGAGLAGADAAAAIAAVFGLFLCIAPWVIPFLISTILWILYPATTALMHFFGWFVEYSIHAGCVAKQLLGYIAFVAALVFSVQISVAFVSDVAGAAAGIAAAAANVANRGRVNAAAGNRRVGQAQAAIDHFLEVFVGLVVVMVAVFGLFLFIAYWVIPFLIITTLWVLYPATTALMHFLGWFVEYTIHAGCAAVQLLGYIALVAALVFPVAVAVGFVSAVVDAIRGRR